MISGAPSAVDSPQATVRPAAPEPDRGELVEQVAALRAELNESRARLTVLSDALAEIEQDPFWRATAPLRRIAAALPPPVRRRLSATVRIVYWGLTPHRMPGRLRWMAYE